MSAKNFRETLNVISSTQLSKFIVVKCFVVSVISSKTRFLLLATYNFLERKNHA